MIQLIGTIASVVFGAVATLIAVQQHVRSLRKQWREQLDEEKKRHSDANVKAYAAQRDFEHLARHLEQHKQALALLQDEVETLKENQVEMKVLLNASFNQMQIIASNTGGGATGGWRKPS